MEIRRCFEKGAYKVQIDFTEARLAVKLDRSGALLNSFIGLNNLALSRFTADERQRIGVHTCPGGDRDSTHSAEVDYADLLPSLFELRAGNFYIALAAESDRKHVLKIIPPLSQAGPAAFVGVVSPIDPHVDTAEEVRDRVLEAAEYIPLAQFGTTTIVVSPRLVTTLLPRAKPLSPRSVLAWTALGLPKKFSEIADDLG